MTRAPPRCQAARRSRPGAGRRPASRRRRRTPIPASVAAPAAPAAARSGARPSGRPRPSPRPRRRRTPRAAVARNGASRRDAGSASGRETGTGGRTGRPRPARRAFRRARRGARGTAGGGTRVGRAAHGSSSDRTDSGAPRDLSAGVGGDSQENLGIFRAGPRKPALHPRSNRGEVPDSCARSQKVHPAGEVPGVILGNPHPTPPAPRAPRDLSGGGSPRRRSRPSRRIPGRWGGRSRARAGPATNASGGRGTPRCGCVRRPPPRRPGG
ncbi:MAG: hypothetical protein JWR55_440 [Aeromicrobium sp.]|nr:hypothetical protein [Aeromicrobium sp.]